MEDLFDDPSLGLEKPKRKPLDVLEGIGTNLMPQPRDAKIPGFAAFGGQLLRSFGESRAAQRGAEQRSSLERRLNMPIDFFLRLSKEAQTDALQRAGIGGKSYMDLPLPELEGQTWRQASEGGLKTHGGQRLVPTSLLPKEQVGGYLSRNFPGIADALSELDRATLEGKRGDESRSKEKHPYEIQKLITEIAENLSQGRSADALNALRNFNLKERMMLSEANPVPEAVLEAARHQGFSQFTPGAQVSWKEFRAITSNNAAMNAFSDALVRTTNQLVEMANSGQKVDDAAVKKVSENVAKSLRGYISDESVKQLKKAIQEHWRLSQGMVQGGVGGATPLPYETNPNADLDPEGSEDARPPSIYGQ